MVESTVKNSALVQVRRDQIIQSALTLFKEKGFHKTTTREIAHIAGFSIGTLYEYIRAKEDVLYLVYESIYEQVSTQMKPLMEAVNPTMDDVLTIVESYFRMMHEMQEEVILLYQEMKSLPQEKRSLVLEKERELIRLFTNIIIEVVPTSFEPKKLEPTSFEIEGLEPTSFELKGLVPTSSELKGLVPTSSELEGLVPTSSELKRLVPTSFEPKTLTKLEAEVIANNILIQGQMWGFRRWALQRQFTFEEYVTFQLAHIKRALHIEEA